MARAHSPVSGDDDGEGEEGEEGGDDAVEGESSVGARSVLEDLEAEATRAARSARSRSSRPLAEASARLCEVADQARRQLERNRRSTLPVSQRQASGVSFKSARVGAQRQLAEEQPPEHGERGGRSRRQ